MRDEGYYGEGEKLANRKLTTDFKNKNINEEKNKT